jgi:hypothetical protein
MEKGSLEGNHLSERLINQEEDEKQGKEEDEKEGKEKNEEDNKEDDIQEGESDENNDQVES